jgi:8-oxo-dGTP diphosphatase
VAVSRASSYSDRLHLTPPRVGVGVFVVHQGRVLLGKRRGAHGAGTWGLPGGHLEHGETIDHCARREVLEETGLDVLDVRLGPYVSDVFPEGKHYVTLFATARPSNGAEARVLEPEKCERWDWFVWEALPEPLFLPLASIKKTGYDPTRG